MNWLSSKRELYFIIITTLTTLQVSKNVGAVTIAHFARILAYLGIMVSADDFNLLVKKYIRNSYAINYIAFVADIQNAANYMDQHGMLDLGGVSY